MSLDKDQKLLRGVEAELQDRSAITRLETELKEEQQRSIAGEKRQRAAEREVEDIEAKLAGVKDKLYGGSVRNPRELVNLERELRQLETILRGKDETALDLMVRVDEMRRSIKEKSDELEQMKQNWERRRGELEAQRAELKREIAVLEERRREMAANIAPDALELYQVLRSAGGRAVVGVERGMCLGCRIALPTNEMRSLGKGELVRCSSCGRILYLP